MDEKPDDINQILRNIPQVEKLLSHGEIAPFIPVLGHNVVAGIIRRVIDAYREKIMEGQNITGERIVRSVVKNCSVKRLHKMQRVINGTGVIIHTNLGRSPVSEKILESLKENLSGYCNLEYHLPTEMRGKRGRYAEELMCELTKAGDALIVNNNAAAVFLILNQFAAGKEVIVSRGELIQIGGGFRIPDIMAQTGAKLVEVGTTNITEAEDYRNAVTPETGMIMSAHKSNFSVEGFTKCPPLRDLAALKTGSILFVRDLGSGNLINDPRLPQPFETTVSAELSQGADLVCFSGDKLLGGCQAGIITGRKDLIELLRKNPLMRMIRVDKITYFILQETLLRYLNGSTEEISLWRIIFQDKKNISGRIGRLLKRIQNEELRKAIERIPTKTTFGGGSLPTIEMESFGLRFTVPGMRPEELYTHFIHSGIPVIGKVSDGAFILDFFTIFDGDIPALAEAVQTLKIPG